MYSPTPANSAAGFTSRQRAQRPTQVGQPDAKAALADLYAEDRDTP